MGSSAKTILKYFTIAVVGLFFFFLGLVKAKTFLAPLAMAILLAMVILPVAKWFEKKGMSRGWSSFFSDLLILFFFVLLAGVVAYQIKSFSAQWPQTKQQLEPKVEQLKDFIENKTWLSVEDSKQSVSGSPANASNQSQRNSSGQSNLKTESIFGMGSSSGQGSSMISTAGSFVMRFLSFLGTFLLTFIYIFFFLLYRRKFCEAIARMVSREKQGQVEQIIKESAKLSQDYLLGKLILLVILAALYSIGLSVSGVEHAILISILAAILTLIPYIGNIIGYVLAMGLALVSGAGAAGAIGVTVTFAVAQFVESYILEPYIVGDKVNLSPVFTIIVVVLGGAIWGIIGMLIAIPALGVAKIIFDHIPALAPLGYLFGQEDTEDDKESNNVFSKTKRWALNKFN